MRDDRFAAQRHAGLRYIGMPLFGIGIVGALWSIVNLISGTGSGLGVGLYLFATGLSLGTFGVHNDTALAHMYRCGTENLPPARALELSAELEGDPAGLRELKPTPLIGLLITFAALTVHLLALHQLMGGM